uniref:UAS domain-containing protein n=1 Tax=Plectus sambesii TaxID=2011161 RepID=A0A914XJD2_9BILA
MAAEALENFRAVTGCENDDEAAHYLDACNSNLAAAVDLFFQRQQADTVPIAPSHRYSNRRQQANQLEEQPSTSNDDVAMISDGDDEVRAPMAPTSGVIVEQSYNQTYNLRGRRRAATNSVFDRFRDFRAEAKNQREVLTRDQRDPRAVVETDNKRQTLESLFRPPVDLIHEGNWESARHAAQTEGRWLLVNVQNAEEFACQALNRDVWANDGVKELVSNNFVFWQVYHDSPDGVRMESYYRLNNYPAIFVVDPRTGEFMISFGRVQDAVSFCDQGMNCFFTDILVFLAKLRLASMLKCHAFPNSDYFFTPKL